MPSDVTLVLSYCSLIYHFHTLVSRISQICSVVFILSIFSSYLHFHSSQIDSLLLHWVDFIIGLSIFHWTFLFNFSLCSFGDLHGSWSCLYTVAYLLKARTVETEKQPLLGNGPYTARRSVVYICNAIVFRKYISIWHEWKFVLIKCEK
jgi:hypothetical protein